MKTTTLGSSLPDRWGLPDSMREDTGVVFASAFPAYDNFAQDVEWLFTNRGRREPLLALEAVRARPRGDEPAVAEVDRRIVELRRQLATEPYVFDQRFLFRCLSMRHSQFAEIIRCSWTQHPGERGMCEHDPVRRRCHVRSPAAMAWLPEDVHASIRSILSR